MSFISWIVLKQYRVVRIMMRKYMLDMTKVDIHLYHSTNSRHKPIVISMQVSNGNSCKMYAYSVDFNNQRIPSAASNELIDNCHQLAKDLLNATQG